MRTVHIPDVGEYDINLILPSGEHIVLQYRNEGNFPSLDICFECERAVTNWSRDMKPAPNAHGLPEDHLCFQLWIGLEPDTEAYL